MKTILLLISESFPIGNAYSSRIKNLIEMLHDLNYNCILLCDDYNDRDNELEKKTVIHQMASKKHSRLNNIVFHPKRYISKVNEILQNNAVDLVISRSMPDRFSRILKIMKIHNIPIILESCERYHHSNWKFGFFNPRFWQFLYVWYFLYPNTSGVIAISEYLTNFYLARNLNVVRIPTIKNVRIISPNLECFNKKKKLVFFGTLGNGKDIIKPLIDLLLSDIEIKNNFELHIYGPSKKQIDRLYKRNKLEYAKIDFVKIHNRIKPDEIDNVLSGYDYGILLRPHRISTIAGFPTKLVDYLSLGIPVITNSIGDIDKFIIDQTHGFKIDRVTKEDLKAVMIKIMNLNQESTFRMRQKSRELAMSSFHYEIYTPILKKLLSEIMRSTNNE